MRERLTTLLLAAAALALFYAFLVPSPPPKPEELGLPLSTEAGRHGYLGLWRWLRSQQVAVAALREPYDRLTGLSAPRGNLLIATLPQRLPARAGELSALDAWVAAGNTLLVVAALDDTPGWAIGASPSFLHALKRMTQLDFQADAEVTRGKSRRAVAAEALDRLFEPFKLSAVPTGVHPLTAGVETLQAESEFPASRWKLHAAERATLELMASGNGPILWLEPSGQGQILVLAVASPLSNGLLAEAGNARFLSNVIAWSLGPGGSVIFDDDHQGAVSYYDASAFFGDPRLHRTILWLIALWLLFVLGSQRLRPAPTPVPPPDVTHFIGVTGGFFASSLTPADAGRRLFENFFTDVRHERAMREDGGPVWEWLASDARVPARQLAELERAHQDVRRGRSVDLVRLQNLLASARGKTR